MKLFKKLASLLGKKKLSIDETIERSAFFDAEFYKKNYDDVAQSELDPIAHYINIGARENRNPSQTFDADFYQLANPEYLLSTPNPLQHYLLEGKAYGALTCPVLKTYSLHNSKKPHNTVTKTKVDTPLKIAFFSHNLNLEGAPLVCKDIAIAMQKIKHFNVTVFSPTDGMLKEQLEAAGIEVIIHTPFNKSNITSHQDFANFIDAFTDTIKQHGFDRIYGNTILSFWLIHVANQLHIPAIFHIHESEPINYHIRSQSFDFVPLIIEALDSAHRVVFVANSTLEKYRHYQKNNNFTVIKNAFSAAEIPTINQSAQEIRDALGIKHNELMIVTIGTVANRKGQIDIINSLMLLDESTLGKIHFVMVGDIDTLYSQYLHKRVDALPSRYAKRVHFIKKTPKVFNYYNAADICLFTSRIESYPKTIQEAMYFRLPIITTPVDGIVEQLQDQYSGLFYQAGDASELTTLITGLSNDSDLRKSLGDNAYSTLETMISPTEMMKGYAELFKQH